MKIHTIEINKFRGISHWREDLSGRNVRILGPNGSGKSSVVQAIEFLLTGDVSQLRGEGTQHVPFPKYASHIDADPKEAWVEGKFVEGGVGTATVRRYVDERDSIEVIQPESESTVPEWLGKQMEAAKLGHSILDRNRLLRFVTAPEGKRGDRMDELFRLEELDDKRVAFKRAVREQDDVVEEKETERKTADKRFFDLFPPGISTRSKAIDHINDRRKELGASPISKLNDGIASNIDVSVGGSVDPLQSVGTTSLLEDIKNWFETRQKSVLESQRKLEEQVKDLRQEEGVERELNTLDLVESGISLLSEYDSECPLCLTDWNEEDLRELLEERRQRAKELATLRDNIDDEYKNIKRLLTEFREELDQLATELGEKHPESRELIENLTETVSSWHGTLKSGALTELPQLPEDADNVQELLFPANVEGEIERLLDLSKSRAEMKPTTEAADLLIRADDRYDELVGKEGAAQDATRLKRTLETIQSHFLDTRERVLSEAFDEIQARFEEYYRHIHQDEEAENFSAVLEPTDTGVRFEPKFYDRGHHHPSAVHSEGHRDSMGLCLFLAMSDVGGDEVDILLLDDVVMSIDSEHRSNIASLLGQEIADRYQVILTTHDKTWDRHLNLTQSFNKQIRFSKCSIGAGPKQVASITDPWEQIDHHLEKEDVTAAAAWIRKTVEWYSRRACDSLRAEVPYHKLENESLSVGILFDTALSRYESLLENGRATERTDYDDEDLQTELDRVREAKRQKERHLNLLNSNIHHNEAEAAFYTGEELRGERDAFKEAYNLLHCTDCNSWVKKGTWGVYCGCGTKADLG